MVSVLESHIGTAKLATIFNISKQSGAKFSNKGTITEGFRLGAAVYVDLYEDVQRGPLAPDDYRGHAPRPNDDRRGLARDLNASRPSCQSPVSLSLYRLSVFSLKNQDNL